MKTLESDYRVGLMAWAAVVLLVIVIILAALPIVVKAVFNGIARAFKSKKRKQRNVNGKKRETIIINYS